MGGAHIALCGAQDQPRPPARTLCYLGHPIVQHVLQLLKSRQAEAKEESGHGHRSSGVTGLAAWAAGQGLGGAGRGL